MSAHRLIAVVKRDCPTCNLVVPVLQQLQAAGRELTVYTQDDPRFPEGIVPVDDTSLEQSYRLGVQIVPTLIRIENERETGRTYGWDRREWEHVSGITALGEGLPDSRPGCGSKTDDPGMAERLAVRYGGFTFRSREVQVGNSDPIEACFERGWSVGLPVVPPTPEACSRC